jgi:hypothetical protein
VEPGPGFALRKSIDQYAVMYAHTTDDSQMRRSSSARTKPALQEDREEPRRSSGLVKNENVPNGRSARRPSVPGKGPCLKGEASPVELIVIVVTRLSYGCPLQAIVHAYDRDCRTVARYQKQVGNHCQKVHEERVMQKHLDLQHVQADAHPGQSLP